MKTLKSCLIKTAAMAGLITTLYGCQNAAAQTKEDYSFNKTGIAIQTYRDIDEGITSIYAADLDNDGKLEIIAGTDHGRILIYKNKVPDTKVEAER